MNPFIILDINQQVQTLDRFSKQVDYLHPSLYLLKFCKNKHFNENKHGHHEIIEVLHLFIISQAICIHRDDIFLDMVLLYGLIIK